MRVLLTGGAGYIGTHTAVELLSAGHEVVVVDDFSNSSPEAIRRVERLTNRPVELHEADVLDGEALERTFTSQSIDAVVHFAGLKAVGESVADPLRYYHTNIVGAIRLCETMLRHQVHRLVFSSSATVYGEPQRTPIDESDPVIDATNPYGRSKLFIERLLEDVCLANPQLNVARLRYFNPAGAHVSGEIGEDPTGVPANLVPFVSQFAVGRQKELVVFGNDYDTPDGTCIRDYIHVSDLALGHLAALEKLAQNPGLVTYNLGTGRGRSVLEVINAYERANGIKLPYRIGPRRPGDVPASYTDPALAERELGWTATRDIEEICHDAFHWQDRNPDGFNVP